MRTQNFVFFGDDDIHTIDEASVERALQFLQREGGEGPDAPEGPVRPFVCGPEGFVSAASSLLVVGFGFHEEDLLIEKWW